MESLNSHVYQLENLFKSCQAATEDLFMRGRGGGTLVTYFTVCYRLNQI